MVQEAGSGNNNGLTPGGKRWVLPTLRSLLKSGVSRRGRERENLTLWFVMLFTFSVFFPNFASSQSFLSNPSNRFLSASFAPGKFLHWSGDISFLSVGAADPSQKLEFLSEAMFFASVGGVVLRATEEKDDSGPPRSTDKSIDPVNYLMFFEPGTEGELKSVREKVNEISKEGIEISDDLMELLNDKVSKQGNGCFIGVGTKTGSSNEIDAILGIVDPSVSNSDRLTCYRSVALLSLGIHPAMNEHEILMNSIEKTVKVEDLSEAIIELTASRICWQELGLDDIECPASIVYRMLKLHGSLADQ